MRGRKPKQESRAVEIRQRLMLWKLEPELSRPSLRALSRQLGVSHQLLKHFLDGLDEWEFEERFRAANEMAQKRAKDVRALAKAENRKMTMRECCEAILIPGEFNRLRSIMDDAKRGPLYFDQIKILKLLARQLPLAQEFLQKCSQQKGVRRRTFEEDHPELRVHILISRFEERDGILWLDDEGRVLYFVPSNDAKIRALLTRLWKRRAEVKRIIEEQVTRLKEQGRYDEIKAKIYQHFPPSTLSPLDEFKDTGATPQKG